MIFLTKWPILALAAFLLLLPLCFAQDLNMTEEELNALIQQRIAESIPQQPQQPVVVQQQPDEVLHQKVDLLVSELGELKAVNERLQEKFTTLSLEFDAKLSQAAEQIFSQVSADTETKIKASEERVMLFTREQTNPVRMNLPSIGVFLMAVALFLILIARTYSFKGKEVAIAPKREGKEKPKKEPEKKKEPPKVEPPKPKPEPFKPAFEEKLPEVTIEETKKPEKKRFGLFRRKPKEEQPKIIRAEDLEFSVLAEKIVGSNLSAEEQLKVLEIYKEKMKHG